MTHYNVDYSKITGKDKADKAIADIKEYIGDAKFDEFTKAFKRANISLDEIDMICGLFIGIKGYPVVAWYEYISSLKSADI